MTPFVDGSAAEPVSLNGTMLAPMATTWTIGNSAEGLDGSGLNRYFEGVIDELRVSTVVRSGV